MTKTSNVENYSVETVSYSTSVKELENLSEQNQCNSVTFKASGIFFSIPTLMNGQKYEVRIKVA